MKAETEHVMSISMSRVPFMLRVVLFLDLILLLTVCSNLVFQPLSKAQTVAPPRITTTGSILTENAGISATPMHGATSISTESNPAGTDWLMWSTIFAAILAFITFIGIVASLIISIKSIKMATHQEKVALDQLTNALLATQISQGDLTLTAYAHAVQGILDLKRSFAERPLIFENQMNLNRQLKQYIPEYMQDDIPTFLTFAAGMWRFSYVYSVMKRPDQFGLTPKEVAGLEKEMRLWLEEVPGFYHVYERHTRQIGANNQDFLDFLNDEVYNQKWRDSHKDFLTIPKRNASGKVWSRMLGKQRKRI
jgi:hypothetical protein